MSDYVKSHLTYIKEQNDPTTHYVILEHPNVIGLRAWLALA